MHLLAWQGKVFDPDAASCATRSCRSACTRSAPRSTRDASWFDGQDAIVLDYSKTSLVAHWIRDEIRLVAPGIYLGIVFWERDRMLSTSR